jgi:Tfp pilus assembly protein PilX
MNRDKPIRRTARSRSRSGAALVAALFCMAAISAIAMATVRTALIEQRQALRREQELQSLWLAESAAERAAVRAHAEEGYTGETWRATVGPEEDSPAGVVVISVESDSAGQRKIVAVARFPDDERWGIVTRKELSFQ